jgi:hypothetical protein
VDRTWAPGGEENFFFRGELDEPGAKPLQSDRTWVFWRCFV